MNRITKLAAAMALAAVPAAAALAPAATAATPSCGSICVSPFVRDVGKGSVLDVYKRTASVGQPVILFAATNSDPAEDWTISNQGTVADFAAVHLMSQTLALNFGSDPAWELEYSPYGADTGLCMGITGGAFSGQKVTLQPCGQTAATVWVDDLAKASGKWHVAINGTDNSFSHPLVLAYPAGASPTQMPRPQLYVGTISQFSTGTVADNEQLSARTGVLP